MKRLSAISGLTVMILSYQNCGGGFPESGGSGSVGLVAPAPTLPTTNPSTASPSSHPCSVMLSTASDFSQMQQPASGGTPNTGKIFCLANDITFTASQQPPSDIQLSASVFDGQNHRLIGLQLGNYGLFHLVQDSQILNLILDGPDFAPGVLTPTNGDGVTALFVGFTYSSQLSNISILNIGHGFTISGSNCGLIAGLSIDSTMTNISIKGDSVHFGACDSAGILVGSLNSSQVSQANVSLTGSLSFGSENYKGIAFGVVDLSETPDSTFAQSSLVLPSITGLTVVPPPAAIYSSSQLYGKGMVPFLPSNITLNGVLQ